MHLANNYFFGDKHVRNEKILYRTMYVCNAVDWYMCDRVTMNISQEDIDEQTAALMHEIECSNEPNHECCAYNDCRACVGE